MNPGQPVAPAPTTTNPIGVGSVTPNAAPTPTQLPTSPQIAATPPPVATPNFNTSGALADIANYYNIPRQTAAIAGAGQAQGNVTQANFEAQKAQNQIKIQNQQDSLDPSKYQFTKNADGSVSILNSVGDKVDIGTYASLTGANPATALQQAGATDQQSQQFMAAYNNLETYVQDKIAASNGDVQAQAAVNDFYKQNPGLQNLELGQLQTAFMQQYGSYFGQSQNPSQYNQLGNAPNVSPTLTSQNNPYSASAYENPNYATAFQNNQFQQSGTGSLSSELSSLQSQSGS